MASISDYVNCQAFFAIPYRILLGTHFLCWNSPYACTVSSATDSPLPATDMAVRIECSCPFVEGNPSC